MSDMRNVPEFFSALYWNICFAIGFVAVFRYIRTDWATKWMFRINLIHFFHQIHFVSQIIKSAVKWMFFFVFRVLASRNSKPSFISFKIIKIVCKWRQQNFEKRVFYLIPFIWRKMYTSKTYRQLEHCNCRSGISRNALFDFSWLSPIIAAPVMSEQSHICFRKIDTNRFDYFISPSLFLLLISIDRYGNESSSC